MMIRVEMQVEDRSAGDGLDGRGDLLDDAPVPAFAEIRHALDNRLHETKPLPRTKRPTQPKSICVERLDGP